jgi:hypothetical protein
MNNDDKHRVDGPIPKEMWAERDCSMGKGCEEIRKKARSGSVGEIMRWRAARWRAAGYLVYTQGMFPSTWPRFVRSPFGCVRGVNFVVIE